MAAASELDSEVASRDDRIVSLMPLVHRIARTVARQTSMEVEDLISEGMIGAIQAVDKWDPSTGVPLMAFALRRIRGQMFDFTRAYSAIKRKHYEEMRESGQWIWTSSLDAEIQSSADDGQLSLLDVLPDDEDTITRMIDVLAMREVLDELPQEHREILYMYYYDEMKLREIARLYGISEAGTSQRLSRARQAAYRHIAEAAE